MSLVTPIALVLFALSAPAPARAAETVVMVPFQNLSGAGGAPAAVSAELARQMESRGYRVVRGEAVDEFLAAEKIRYLDSLPASIREKLLQRFEASAVVLGTIFDFAESDNPVVAVSARLVGADGKVAWSAVAGLSADDTKKVFGFGRLASLDALAARTVSILTRDLPKPGSASKLESARSKPLDLSSPRTFRSAALAGGGNLVCVLPLENRSAARVAPRVVGELLAQRLAASEGFRVVEAAEFRNAMVAAGVYGIRTGDPEELKKLGAKVGTNLFVKGTIYAYKDVLPGSGVTTPEIELQLTARGRRGREGPLDVEPRAQGARLQRAAPARRDLERRHAGRPGRRRNDPGGRERPARREPGRRARRGTLSGADAREVVVTRAAGSNSGRSAMRSLRWVPLLAATVLLAGCASTSYLAKVNDQAITGPELNQEFVRLHGGHAKFLGGESETRQFLDLVIDQDLLVQEAYRLELEDIPAIQGAVKEYEDRKASEYFVKVEIQQKSVPTPEQVREAWERETSELYQAREILLDTRSEADAVYLQLLFGVEFDLLARQCSIAPSRVHGGRLSPIGWGARSPAWEDAVFPLGPGETTAPFETPEGWQIVELLSVDVVEKADFGKASPKIQAILAKRMVEQRRREVSDSLWKKYHARQSDLALDPESLRQAVTKTPDAAIVTWDGGQLTVKEFLSAVDWSVMPADYPGRFQAQMETQLRQIVNAPLVLLEARAQGYEKAPDVAGAVRRYQEDLMERALYADYIFKGLTVTDQEVRDYYDSHKADYIGPEKRRVAHIVVPTREEAEEIEKAIAEGEQFEKLVSRSTDTESAKKLGNLGWVTRQDAVGELEAVFSLEEGQVSQPIASKYGYHVFLVRKIVTGEPLEFEEAKDRIRKKLIEQKERDKRKLWVQKLRETSKIEINNAGIRAFVKANAAT